VTRDLVISMFAGERIPSGVPFATPPRVMQWQPPITGAGHPSWTGEADKLRAGAYRKGPLLPNLLRRYGMKLDDVGRICVLGFSAGSNNGVRELLRSDDDQRRIDVVLAVDGLHPNLAVSPKAPPRGAYADWQAEMEPFAAFASRASLGAGAMVATASQVAAPSKGNAQTARALADLELDVVDRLPAGAELGPTLLPEDFPTSGDPLKPITRHQVGSFAALWYAGSDKTAHILQGTAVVRDLWRDVLSRRWSPETVGELVSLTSGQAPRPPQLGRRFPALIPAATAVLSVAGALVFSR
jgi:hypothetical protein